MTAMDRPSSDMRASEITIRSHDPLTHRFLLLAGAFAAVAAMLA